MKGCGWIEIWEFCLPVSNAESSWGMVKQISENECRWQYLEVLTRFLILETTFCEYEFRRNILGSRRLEGQPSAVEDLADKKSWGALCMPWSERESSICLTYLPTKGAQQQELPICPQRKKGQTSAEKKKLPMESNVTLFEIWPKASGVFCSPTN